MAGPRDARQRGNAIEQIAARWLSEKGLCLVESNYHVKGGEIDLIMRHCEVLVFIEVRHRADTRHGHPLETVTHTKQRRLIRAARFYLQRNRLSCPCRFDVLAVTGHSLELEFEWIQGAFDAF